MGNDVHASIYPMNVPDNTVDRDNEERNGKQEAEYNAAELFMLSIGIVRVLVGEGVRLIDRTWSTSRPPWGRLLPL